MRISKIQITRSNLEYITHIKYGDPSKMGWSPRMRHRFGYFTPDDYYEAFVSKFIKAETCWLDVGCGRDVFPSNRHLAAVLSKRCKKLVGVDPDENINENEFLHEKHKGYLEDFYFPQQFDVITLRMVAEHVANPELTVQSLNRLTRVGGKVIVYTIYKHSPVPIITRLIPFSLHHPIKKLLWDTEQKDTFPITYRMNTRKELAEIFCNLGFREIMFEGLDDCRIFYNFRMLHFLELTCRHYMNKFGLKYPEKCILAVYEKSRTLE